MAVAPEVYNMTNLGTTLRHSWSVNPCSFKQVLFRSFRRSQNLPIGVTGRHRKTSITRARQYGNASESSWSGTRFEPSTRSSSCWAFLWIWGNFAIARMNHPVDDSVWTANLFRSRWCTRVRWLYSQSQLPLDTRTGRQLYDPDNVKTEHVPANELADASDAHDSCS